MTQLHKHGAHHGANGGEDISVGQTRLARVEVAVSQYFKIFQHIYQ